MRQVIPILLFLLSLTGNLLAEMPEEPSIDQLTSSSQVVAIGYFQKEESFEPTTNNHCSCMIFQIAETLKGDVIFDPSFEDRQGKFIGVLIQTRRPGCAQLQQYKKGEKYLLFLSNPIFDSGNLYRKSQIDAIWHERSAVDKTVKRIRELLQPKKPLDRKE